MKIREQTDHVNEVEVRNDSIKANAPTVTKRHAPVCEIIEMSARLNQHTNIYNNERFQRNIGINFILLKSFMRGTEQCFLKNLKV